MKMKLHTTEIFEIQDDTPPMDVLDLLVDKQLSREKDDLPEDVWWGWEPVDQEVFRRWGLSQEDIDAWLAQHGEFRP